MRVIAGKAKGRALTAPPGMDTRPITAMMKEALFSIWQFRIAGTDFLDLFAGSGSMGIEALSRGARRAVFVEQDRKATEVIRKNLNVCKLTDSAVVCQDDVFRRISVLKNNGETFDIIYLDPPFTNDGIFYPVLETVTEAGILKEGGVITIRTKKEKQMPETINGFTRSKLKVYGLSAIHFYERET